TCCAQEVQLSSAANVSETPNELRHIMARASVPEKLAVFARLNIIFVNFIFFFVFPSCSTRTSRAHAERREHHRLRNGFNDGMIDFSVLTIDFITTIPHGARRM